MVALVSKTQFIPPQTKECWWKTDLWDKYLQMENYQGTLIKAPPCYGKSMTVADFFKTKQDFEFIWYNIREDDIRLEYFFRNFLQAGHYFYNNYEEKLVTLPETLDEESFSLRFNKLINLLLESTERDLFFILDNYQFIRAAEKINNYLSKFFQMLPPNFHLIIISRGDVNLKHWSQFRLKQKVMVINREDLSLKEEEISDFLNFRYELDLTEQQIHRILQITEGWIIGVDYIGQRLNSSQRLEQLLPPTPENFSLLFEFFELELLETQSQRVRDFILQTAFLSNLTVELCNKVLNIDDSRQILRQLNQAGLFVFKVGEGKYRYHKLFKQVVSWLGKKKFNYCQLKKKVVSYYWQQNKLQKAVNYSIESQAYQKAAEFIINSGSQLLEYGKLNSLQKNLDQLPSNIFQTHPQLFIFKGDVYRLKNKFKQAETNYQQAREIFFQRDEQLNLTKALERIALVYLDTAQPEESDYYLQQALQIREEKELWAEADFLQMLAETKADKGNLAEALELKSKLDQVVERDFPLDNNLNSRVQLRTGQLERAENILTNKLKVETIDHRTHNSYRETMLVLSLIKSFKGEPKAARKYAEKGIDLGKQFNASFVEAVGYMRLGHAYQLLEEKSNSLKFSLINQARDTYFKAIEMVKELDIKRGKAEPLMGLALLEGFCGDRELGSEYALEGIKICKEAGDSWLAGLLRVGLAINYYFACKIEKAEKSFLQAKNKFDYAQDSFGEAICELWFALILQKKGEESLLEDSMQKLVPLIEENGYNYLYSRATLFGARDPNLFAPLWVKAEEKGIKEKKVTIITSHLGVKGQTNHPGYSLRIKTLGDFRLWRGREEVKSNNWTRKKAKELFHLFIVHKGDLLLKDRIYFFLWPDKNEKKAHRNFKVTLNCLKKILEPNREPRQTPFFLTRRNSAYGLDPDSSYILDVERFEELIKQGNKATEVEPKIKYYESAMELYQGDFLPESLYTEWIRKERVRLRELFLNTADKLIEHYYEKNKLQKCITQCNQVLKVDECWENAYYYQIKSYNQLNNRSMAIKVYEKCKEILNNKLDLTPSSKIKKLYQVIT